MAGSVSDMAGPCQLALEASTSGVLVVDDAGTIVLVNREIEEQFGYPRDELIGRSVELLVPELIRAAHDEQREADRGAPDARAPGGRREYSGRRRDGSSLPLEIGLSAIAGAEVPLLLATVVNVSERRRFDEARRAAISDRLEFEQRVAELSTQFINVPADQITTAVRDALGQVCEALELDRGTLFALRADVLSDGIGWARPGILPCEGASGETCPWILQHIRSNEAVCVSTCDDVPSETDRATFVAAGVRSAVVVPLSVDGEVVGAVSFNAVRAEREWQPEVVHRLKTIATVFGEVMARRQRERALRDALAEVERLKEDLQNENVQLRHEIKASRELTTVVGRSASVRAVVEQIAQVAPTDSTVLLLGETGTGKELFASQIHELSARRGRTMIRVNCAAIPATLIESELFGRERGAFTGALARQVGRFELANGSTIFLDEIGDLPAEVQVKLLRVLEERKIERLGSPQSLSVDTRIIAATHRDLEQRIAEGAFRDDLFYRLNVFPIRVPPLRERSEDIPLLVWRFVEDFSKSFGKRIESIAQENLAALQQYSWPGNIRELRNVVERAMITAAGTRLTIPPPAATTTAARRSARLVDVEREHIRSVLDRTAWRVRGTGGAADRLGLKPTTLETRMAKLGLKRPRRD